MSDKTKTSLVKHVAELAHIPITSIEEKNIATAFDETLAVVDKLKKVDVSKVEPTHQVTGLENILREDKINHDAMFSQKQALANATSTHKGYFVVNRVIHQDE